MGSLFSAPKVPTPPAPPPPSTYTDEINGVEQVPVTAADGSTHYITRALPLTAEQQAQKNQMNEILSDSLAQIQKLSASDYAPDETTQKVLAQWRDTQQKVLSDGFTQRTQQEEQTLAARGLGDSSTATAVRRTRRLDQQNAEQNLQNQQDELGSQVRAQNLQLQQQLYGLAASGIDSSQAAQQAAAAKSLSGSISSDTTRQASILDYYNRAQSAANNQYSVFGNIVSRGVNVLSGGLLSPGSNLGSLFK